MSQEHQVFTWWLMRAVVRKGDPRESCDVDGCHHILWAQARHNISGCNVLCFPTLGVCLLRGTISSSRTRTASYSFFNHTWHYVNNKSVSLNQLISNRGCHPKEGKKAQHNHKIPGKWLNQSKQVGQCGCLYLFNSAEKYCPPAEKRTKSKYFQLEELSWQGGPCFSPGTQGNAIHSTNQDRFLCMLYTKPWGLPLWHFELFVEWNYSDCVRLWGVVTK